MPNNSKQTYNQSYFDIVSDSHIKCTVQFSVDSSGLYNTHLRFQSAYSNYCH